MLSLSASLLGLYDLMRIRRDLLLLWQPLCILNASQILNVGAKRPDTQVKSIAKLLCVCDVPFIVLQRQVIVIVNIEPGSFMFAIHFRYAGRYMIFIL